MIRLRLLTALGVVLGVVATTAQATSGESCPEQTRPHATRCDQYFRCVLLPSRTHVWVPTQCAKGLIYEPQLKTCVLPGDDWECNLSAETGTDESGENVYGINNLPAAIYTGPTAAAPPPSPPRRRPETVTDANIPTVSGNNEGGYYIVLDRDGNNRTTYYHTVPPTENRDRDQYEDNTSGGFTYNFDDPDGDEESSGDGLVLLDVDEGPATPAYETMEKHSTTAMGVFSEKTTELSKNELNSFLADYTLKATGSTPTPTTTVTTKTRTKTKTKLPLPADGKIHPEHLTAILTQQKKLNRIASRLKLKEDPTGGVGDKSPFSDQPVFTSRPEGSVLFNVAPQRIPEETQTHKSPFMSEDVIRSIIEISKQMMAHQKTQSQEEMYVKPIFIPISVSSATQDFTPNKPSKIMFHQLFPSLSNNTTQFSAKPIGITITNPYTLGQATIYDNLRDQVMNDSQYYNYQATMADVYGNRYQSGPSPPQSMPNVPMYPYPPTMAYPVFSQQQSYPSYPAPAPYYNPPQAQQQSPQQALLNRLRNTIGYEHVESQSNENVISDEQDAEEDDSPISAELPEKQATATINLQNSNEANGDEDDVEDMMETKKLISVGGATLNFNDYKDSILPLLDANPDDVRISVLTCSLGSRQPNKTDCTKYYVCNPHNGAFQSFTCPSFTAFNAESRVCDMATFKSCQARPNSPTPPSTALSRLAQQHKLKQKINSDTSKLQSELMAAHKYVDLIKHQAIKILSRTKATETLAADDEDVELLTELTAINPTAISPTITTPGLTSTSTTTTASKKRTKPKRKHASTHKKRPTATKRIKGKTAATKSVGTTTTTVAPTTTPVPKAPKCKQNGKIPDPAVKYNYYVCYKANPKKFIKTRMACPNKLVYCAKTEYCTFEKNCKD
ncbi:uncharacterized protein LOC120418700 [Culex pipiens pallens]|uniref:uncharacterized protein LOC120418700 n=1 Tax=Culex pipiens pallens TaxID=42434 RepID=UPI001952D2F2|nr:uncharacterized protein LOC120418700 [Culex pipiens pallens]